MCPARLLCQNLMGLGLYFRVRACHSYIRSGIVAEAYVKVYKEGELLTFLLKLSPEQEKYASWSLNTTGPALVKGGPGTGKSTVALYRIRSLLSQLHKTGKGVPRVLVASYA